MVWWDEIRDVCIRVSNFNKSINGHHHMKDHVEIGHLTKYDTFRMNRDHAMGLEI